MKEPAVKPTKRGRGRPRKLPEALPNMVAMDEMNVVQKPLMTIELVEPISPSVIGAGIEDGEEPREMDETLHNWNQWAGAFSAVFIKGCLAVTAILTVALIVIYIAINYIK